MLGVPKNKPKVAPKRPMTGNDRRAPLCHAARVQKIEKIAASFAPKVPMTGRARSVMAPSVPKNRGNDAEIRPQAADDSVTSPPGWRPAQHRAPPVSMLLLFEHSDFDFAEISHPTPDAPKTPCCTPIFFGF